MSIGCSLIIIVQMQNPTPLPEWENTKIPWIRASNLTKPPLDIRAPVRPFYYRGLILFIVNMVMWLAISYIAVVITYYSFTIHLRNS